MTNKLNNFSASSYDHLYNKNRDRAAFFLKFEIKKFKIR